MFDKSSQQFPVKEEYTFLSHCGVSPLYSGGLRREIEIAQLQSRQGSLLVARYDALVDELRQAAARLLQTSPDNLAFLKNTTEGIGLIANGYPFRPGDQVIGYVHEYPANYYPWKLQERRGVEYVLLPNTDLAGAPCSGLPLAWSMADLERRVTKRTRVLALSHVQFTSGFAADLVRLGEFCRAHDIDLVLDVAQSLGSLPLEPEKLHVAALASSGWKWLLGPMGTGLLYTSEALRQKLEPVQVGAETMRQGVDYLNHSWDPLPTAKRFEYSTSPISLAAALAACLTELHLRYGVEAIRREIFRLQDIFLARLDRDRFQALVFPEAHRSPILSLTGPVESRALARALRREKVVCTERGGYLRVAPHFYNTDEEMERVAELLNRVAG
jgi:selenocysteine lyase/cysteine desulfurase